MGSREEGWRVALTNITNKENRIDYIEYVINSKENTDFEYNI